MRGSQLGRQRLAHSLDACRGQRVVQAGAGMQAALGVPVGNQQGKLAAQQREDARIAARADDGGCLVEVRHALHVRLVRGEGLAVQAGALHQRQPVLQHLLGQAADHAGRDAEQGGIDLFQLADMADHRDVAQPVERRGGAPHHAGQRQGGVAEQQLGALVPQIAQADHRDLSFFHVFFL
ncbi:hypothetical protein D3C81_1377640 [compost metagenome]